MKKSPIQVYLNRLLLAVTALLVAACFCSNPVPDISQTLPGSNGPSTADMIDDYGIPRDNTLVLLAGEGETLDPAKWLYGAEGVIEDLYSGLVRQGAGLVPVPDLAESWDISQDGLVYTFHLRQGVTFHDGKAFTAGDVRYSWERAASPELGSNTALTYLDDISGVREVAAGEATSISGLRVVDDYTLEVTLEAPVAYFLHKIAMPVAWVVDSERVDQIETAPNGTGPFFLARHDKDQVFILERYPDYYLGPVPLAYVVYRLYAGYPIRLYEAGDIDMTSISKDMVERAQDPSDPLYGNVQTLSPLCTDYRLFDTSKPPFDDPRVRQAFVLAIDKDRYNEAVMGGEGVIARGLYPPGLPGYTPDVEPIRFDPEAAEQMLRQSSYGGPDNLPEITFTTYGSEGDISPADGMLIQMWQEVLGVTVTPQGFDSLDFQEQLYSGRQGQIMNSGWCADYPDPSNFANLFHSRSNQNHGHYSSPELDTLLAEAQSERDIDLRIELYQQAQQMIVDDAAALFLTHYQPYYVVTKPYVAGYVASPIGVPQHMYMSIRGQ